MGGPSRERTVVLALALIGLLYLFFSAQGSPQPRVSLWSGPGAAVRQAQAAAGGLTGAATQQQIGRGLGDDSRPQGNPLGVPNTVMTQGYGVGSHAPAEAWGAIDLAIDGDGDGAADPEGSLDHPVYATHSGVVKLTPNSWPAGNHIWVANDQYRTGYSHLSGFAIADGQAVRPGDLIGYLGSSGMSSGPHLDYQVWQMQAGQWVNQNPLGFAPFDGAP